MYDKSEIANLCLVIKNSPSLEPIYRLHAARILFTNLIKCKSISLSDALTFLQQLLEASKPEEQKWIVRSFAVLTKHIDRSKESVGTVHSFTKYLCELASHNKSIIPYLGYFGTYDHTCRSAVLGFYRDYVNAEKYDPIKSHLNYDFLKSIVLMNAQSGIDFETASLLSEVLSRSDPHLGSKLQSYFHNHIDAVLRAETEVFFKFRDIFSFEPDYNTAIEYYLNMQLIRTDGSEDMALVRNYLKEIYLNPKNHKFGGKKGLGYHNVGKALYTALRDEQEDLANQAAGSTDSLSILDRRNMNNFRLY